jgi:hypothetical protein
MRKMVLGLAAASFGLGPASWAVAQTPPPLVIHQAPAVPAADPEPVTYLDRGAVNGRKQELYTYAELNPDCTLAGDPTILVASRPAHGQISIERGDVFVTYAEGNPRAACNSTKVHGQIVYYTAEAGYQGADSFELEIVGSFGHLHRYHFRLTVR